MQIKLLFTREDLHLALFRKWMLFEYGNSLLFLSTGRKKYRHMVMKKIQAKSTALFQFFFLFLRLCATQDKDKNYNIAILFLTILCCVYFIGNSKPDVRFWGKGPTVLMFLICLFFLSKLANDMTSDYAYTVLLMLKSGLLIANQMWEIYYCTDWHFFCSPSGPRSYNLW